MGTGVSEGQRKVKTGDSKDRGQWGRESVETRDSGDGSSLWRGDLSESVRFHLSRRHGVSAHQPVDPPSETFGAVATVFGRAKVLRLSFALTIQSVLSGAA